MLVCRRDLDKADNPELAAVNVSCTFVLLYVCVWCVKNAIPEALLCLALPEIEPLCVKTKRSFSVCALRVTEPLKVSDLRYGRLAKSISRALSTAR